jgi:uncharacterized membrane protein
MTLRAVIAVGLPVGAIAMTAAVLAAPAPLRTIVVLPLALLLPGTAIFLVVFPGRSGLGKTGDLAVAVLLSLVFYPLTALVLHAFSIKLDATSVAAAVDVVVAAAYPIAAFSSLDAQPARGEHNGRALSVAGRRDVRAASRAAVIAGALVATLAAARAVLPAPPPDHYTAFAVTGRWAHVQGVADVNPATAFRVGVEVKNATSRAIRYRIRTSTPGGRWSRPTVTVPAGTTWDGFVTGHIRPYPCYQRLLLALHSKTPRPLRLSIQLRVARAGCRGVR